LQGVPATQQRLAGALAVVDAHIECGLDLRRHPRRSSPRRGRRSPRTFPSVRGRSNWIRTRAFFEQIGDQIGDPMEHVADDVMFHTLL
jgi:hypothetical protein